MNRVLLIGHHLPTDQSLPRTLGGLGFGVDVASDSAAGLSFASRRRYSHVLIDDELQSPSAVQLFRQLQHSTVGILLTTVANLNVVYSAVDAGIRRVLTKPVDYDQLLPLLDPSLEATTRSFSEAEIASLSQTDIHENLTTTDLIDIIRSVDYPFAGKHRLEHFDRDTLERVVHLITRWCRQRQKRAAETLLAG